MWRAGLSRAGLRSGLNEAQGRVSVISQCEFWALVRRHAFHNAIATLTFPKPSSV